MNEKSKMNNSADKKEDVSTFEGWMCFLGFLCLFFLVIFLLNKGCTACSEYIQKSASEDDRWEYLQKHIDEDPYYRQWK